MISRILKFYSELVLDSIYTDNEILFFANIRNLGIGNLVWMYPAMKAFERSRLTVVCEDSEMREILNINIPTANFVSFDKIPTRIKYGVSINNFLTQTRQNVMKIISLRIPCRVGHTFEGDKYSWLFNYQIPMDDAVGEALSNSNLLKPFALEPAPLKLKVPFSSNKYSHFDVLIQPHTSNEPKRNYADYKSVIEQLDCRVGLIGSAKEWGYCEEISYATKATNLCGMSLIDTANLMKGAVVVGNDGGLVKLAYAIGAPVIQIVKRDSEYFHRSWIVGNTLIDPNPFEVVREISKRLSGVSLVV